MSVAVPLDSVHAFVGSPALLAAGAPHGPLAGTTLAVKDLFDVAGTVTGAGNPAFVTGRPPARENARAVELLVAAGASVIGKTITDELAYSLAGSNSHFGTPTNPAAPGRLPGGSSSGSAAAVAAGLCDLALGTDTGGSIRVPASYCGILGWRPTHGAVSADGVVPLAPSFDTVGLLARSAGLLLAAAGVLVGGGPAPAAATVVDDDGVVDELLDVVGPSARGSVVDVTRSWGAPAEALGIDLVAAADAFRVLQSAEAWAQHGAWITATRPTMGPGVSGRFAAASRITPDEVAAAAQVRSRVRAVVLDATAGGRVLVGPAAAGGAPPVAEPDPRVRAAHRLRTLRLTCLAGLAGAPVVVLPLATDDGLPLGIACLGAPGADLALLRWSGDRAGRPPPARSTDT